MGGFMSLGRRNEQLTLRPDPSLTVKVQVPGYGEIAMSVPGTDEDDVRATFIEWLKGDENDGDWRTIDAVIDGSSKRITFKSSWVAGFTVNGR